MADCAAFPSCTWLQLERRLAVISPIRRTVSPSPRKHVLQKYRVTDSFGSWKFSGVDASLSISLKGSKHPKEILKKCYCLGSLMNPETVAPLNWVPLVDQMLLMTSILFAYMAGVIPRDKAFSKAQQSNVDEDGKASSSTISVKGKTWSNSEDSWTEVKGKLLDAIDAFDHSGDLYNSAVEFENYSANRPLSLLAITGGPRLRLLYTTLQQLHKEVIHTSQIHESASRDAWMVVSSKLIQGSSQAICLEWLEGELSLENKDRDMDVISKNFKLDRDDLIQQKIKRLEKADLYADLLYFLRFGSLSTHCCYNDNLLAQYGVVILEDLVVTLADGISSMYLELVSVDSNLSSEIDGLGLSLCSLSTRALQRLRNEVALNTWLLKNFESVALMYEDRFELCVLHRKLCEEPDINKSEKFNLWKKLFFKKSVSLASSSHYVVINQLPLFVKRTKELRGLTGWRYYYSLYLELSDIAMPLVRSVFVKARNAVSFFLTCLIGRSLGLIYTGIRQSLGWR